MIEQWIYDKLKKDIGLERFKHSIGVMNTSIELAKEYDYSQDKAKIAGLLHDCGKFEGEINLLKRAHDFDIILDDITKANVKLIHSPLGAEIARREYNIEDKDILHAIRFHTTGRENMSLLEKIVYIADIIEPARDFPDVGTIRELAYKDIDKAVLFSLDSTIKLLIDRKLLIHLDAIKARNHLLLKALK